MDKKKKKEKYKNSKYLHGKNGISVDEAHKFLSENYVIDTNKRTQKIKNPRFTK